MERYVNGSAQTIFYQGVFSSQSQAAKYVGKKGFLATTNEYIISKYSLELIQNVFIGKELDDIVLGSSYSPLTFLSYGIADTKNKLQGVTVIDNNIDDDEPVNYTVCPRRKKSTKAESMRCYRLNISRINLGQEIDVGEHQQKYNLCLEQHPDQKIILYGVSRGAATTFNAVCLNNYDLSRVKLVILEGCFDSIPNIAKYNPFSPLKYLMPLHDWLPVKYSNNSHHPVNLIDQFPLELPVVFITSARDSVVPYHNTVNLAKRLHDRGHRKIHFLVLKRASHSGYTFECPFDANQYLGFIHEIYQTYDLPYISEYLPQKVDEIRF